MPDHDTGANGAEMPGVMKKRIAQRFVAKTNPMNKERTPSSPSIKEDADSIGKAIAALARRTKMVVVLIASAITITLAVMAAGAIGNRLDNVELEVKSLRATASEVIYIKGMMEVMFRKEIGTEPKFHPSVTYPHPVKE